MSSILKALEKAEQSHSTRRNAGESGLIRARKHRISWIMPAAVFCGAVIAALITFAAMGGFSRQTPVAQLPAVVTRTGPVVVAPLNPVTQEPAERPDISPPVEPVPVIAVSSPKVTAPLILPGKAGRAVRAPAPHPVTVRPSQMQQSPVQTAPAQTTPVHEGTAAATSEHPRPELKVTGIAWQNNGESSFAIVNGRAVLQGGTVDGFKVVEIHHDTVRFSGSGGSFEVPMGGEENN